MKKYILIITLCLAFMPCAAKADNVSQKYLAEQIKKERLAITNALLLTEEQANSRMKLLQETTVKIDEKSSELFYENMQLKYLQAQNACRSDIQKQKKKITAIKKQIDEIINDENKDFRKILNYEQRSKLNMIQKLERKAVKSCQDIKDYYKSNPKMRPFALNKRPEND